MSGEQKRTLHFRAHPHTKYEKFRSIRFGTDLKRYQLPIDLMTKASNWYWNPLLLLLLVRLQQPSPASHFNWMQPKNHPSSFLVSLLFAVCVFPSCFCKPPVTASFRSLCTFSLNMFGSREFYKEAFKFKCTWHWTRQKPQRARESRTSESERTPRNRNRADVPSRRFSPRPVGACRRSPLFSNIAPASCCSAAKMEPRACISRVLIKGCKCLEAVWSVPQYDLRLTQSIRLETTGRPGGDTRCAVSWASQCQTAACTKGFPSQKERKARFTVWFHQFNIWCTRQDLCFCFSPYSS